MPGYPAMSGYINFGMLPQTAEWLQPNYKSSNRGNHGSNYKGRGRGGRGGGGPGADRNTSVGGQGAGQAFNPSNQYQGYQGQAVQLPYSQYQGGGQQYQRWQNSHNSWETSSQHSNSSGKKFSSSSSSGHDSQGSVVSPQSVPQPRLVPQPVQVQYAPQPAAQFLPATPHLHHGPGQRPQGPGLPKEQEFPQPYAPYHQPQHQLPRGVTDTIQTKEYGTKRGRGGRGGSSRGREDMAGGGYNSVPRGGGHTVGIPPGAPARNVVYQGRHNSGGAGPPGLAPGQDVAPAPAPVPPRPAPEFNMENTDFPALPGAPAPALATEPSRFLEVVKGTAKMKLDDDQDTLPDDLCPPYEEAPRGPDPPSEPGSGILSPKSRSKSSSVSETPVVSVEKINQEQEEQMPIPLTNGEVGHPGGDNPDPSFQMKPGKAGPVPVVSINAVSQERDSGSVSPRQLSLVGQEPTLPVLTMQLPDPCLTPPFSGCRPEVDLRSNYPEKEGGGGGCGEGESGAAGGRGGGC